MKVFKIWIDAPEVGDYESAIVIAKDQRSASEIHPGGLRCNEAGFFIDWLDRPVEQEWCKDSRNVNVMFLANTYSNEIPRVIGYTSREENDS